MFCAPVPIVNNIRYQHDNYLWKAKQNQAHSHWNAEISILSFFYFPPHCARRKGWSKMASLDVVILSSSPPHQFTTFNLPSSSPLPPVCELIQKKAPILRTGSRAAPIPPNATATFTSAASLFAATVSKGVVGVEGIRSERILSGDEGDSTKEISNPKPSSQKPAADKVALGVGKRTKPRKAAMKETIIDGEIKPKKPRKSRVRVVCDVVGDVDTPKVAAPRKARAKKSDKVPVDEIIKDDPIRKPTSKKTATKSQTKIARRQVTKSSSKMASQVKSEKIESTSAMSPDPFTDSVEFGLVEALKRRTHWTPPKPLENTRDVTVEPQSDSDLPYDIALQGRKGFTDLFATFGYAKLDNSPTIARDILDTAEPRKRKLIELVKTSVTTAAAVFPNEKGPKKKAKTITEQALSAYAEEGEASTKTAPLLQYFSLQTMERDARKEFKVPPKPRSRSPVKQSSKKHKDSALASILLSPESALKQSGNQDFVFGTCSQLAREDDPMLLRDLHEAMQASNCEVNGDGPFADSNLESVKLSRTDRGKVVPPIKRDLWSAAARGTASDSLEAEIVEAFESPVVTKQPIEMAKDEAPQLRNPQLEDEDWHDIEQQTDSMAGHVLASEKSPKIGPLETTIRTQHLSSTPKSPVIGGSSQRHSQGTTSQDLFHSTNSNISVGARGIKSRDLTMPDYSSYTTNRLQKEIASYRFKPVKNRDQMITLLEKCWEGKNRIALGTMVTNVLSTAPTEVPKSVVFASNSVSSPKRPRGRPRKDSMVASSPRAEVCRPKKSIAVESIELDSDTPLSQVRTPKKVVKSSKDLIEDISDSDLLTLKTSNRRRGPHIKASPLKLRTSTSRNVDTTQELSTASSQVPLFTHITRAIKNEPPSKGTSKPNWHEKILLYDPIILEDLTLWLNTGALEQVGWDGEVDPKEVKKFCESRSICCLWRENLRGGARNRY